MNRRLALAGLLAPLAAGLGCTSPGTANVERGFDPARTGSSVVVFSGTVTDGYVSAFWYQIESGTGRDRRLLSVPVTGTGITLDWSGTARDGKAFSGRLAVVELPVGVHVLRRAVGAQGATAGFGTPPLEGEFRTAPGDVLYLGNVHATLSVDASSGRVATSVGVVDHRDRDFAILRKQFGSALADRVRVAPLDLGRASGTKPGRLDTTIDDLQGLVGR